MLNFVVIFAGISAVVYGTPRIIGGINTEINQHPYQISLQTDGRHFCGGFLISKTWAITAAHCIETREGPQNIKNLKIRAGSTFWSEGGQLVNVKRAVIHPKFGTSKLNNDIALLNLAEPITDQTASPAKLPNQNSVIQDGAEITVTGWGITSYESFLSTNLQEVQVPYVRRDVCRNIYKSVHLIIYKNMFCAGLLHAEGKDSCQGDSGGPAAIGDVVVGIVSWGYECANPDFPGVYTQLSKYRNWIRKVSKV